MIASNTSESGDQAKYAMTNPRPPTLSALTAALALALIPSAAGAVATPASALELTVAPTRIAVTPPESGAALNIQNRGEEGARYRVTAHAWTQSRAGEMILDDTSDLRVYPREFELGPGERALARALVDGGAGERETAYRIVIERLPSGGEDRAERVRVAIPLFVAGDGSRADVEAENLRVSAQGRARFDLHNRGTAHAFFDEVTVVARDDSGREIGRASRPGWYVLPGGRLGQELALPEEACEGADTLSIEARVGVEARELAGARPFRCGGAAGALP